MEAGVRDFKNRLSENLRKVKAGEEVVITERGRPVAKLSRMVIDPAWPDWMKAMVARGELIPGTGEKPRESGIRMRGKGPSGSEMIIQARKERHDFLVGLIGSDEAKLFRVGPEDKPKARRIGRGARRTRRQS